MFLRSRAIVALCGLLAVTTALTVPAEAGNYPSMLSGSMFGFRRRCCTSSYQSAYYGGAMYGGYGGYSGGFGGGCSSCGAQSYYAPSYGYGYSGFGGGCGMGGCSSCGSCGSCGGCNSCGGGGCGASYYGNSFGCGSCGCSGGNCGIYGCAGGNGGTCDCANGNCGVIGSSGGSQSVQGQKPTPVNPPGRAQEPGGYNGSADATSQPKAPDPTLRSGPAKTGQIPPDDVDPAARTAPDEGFKQPTKPGASGAGGTDGESVEANKLKVEKSVEGAKPGAIEPPPPLNEKKDNTDGASFKDELSPHNVNRPLPKINVDDKVAWKSTATKERLAVVPSYNTARLARVASYPNSGWVATKSQPETTTVAKK